MKAGNKKKLMIGLSAVAVIIGLALAFGLSKYIKNSETSAKNAVQTSANITHHKAKDVNKAETKMKQKNKKQRQSANDEKGKKSIKKKTNPKKEDSKTAANAITKIHPVKKYVTASALHVRSGPGTTYSVISIVKKGAAVTAYALSGSWNKVKTGGHTGWVSGHYLSKTKPVVKQTAPLHKSNSSSDKKTNSESSKTSTSSTSGNTADQLKTVGGNQQLILVTTNGYASSRATIQTYEKDTAGKWHPVLDTTGYVGKYGMTSDMHEGTPKSPIGKFSIGFAFGRYGNPGTKLPYRHITSDDVWVDDSTSPLYNTWQSKNKTKGQWKSAENMDIPAYNYGFVINFNTQRIPYKGSAIFFHVSNMYTLGCTGTSETNVLKILRWLDPAKHPAIIQTPVQGLSKF